jgi:hypothetical protein
MDNRETTAKLIPSTGKNSLGISASNGFLIGEHDIAE